VLLDVIIFVLATIINLIPPIYDRIEKDYGLKNITPISIIVAVYILMAAFFSVFWGYKIDKINRRRVMYYSLFVAIVGMIICAIAPVFWLFAAGLLIAGFGYGAQMPATYSILSDIIPSRYWATFYGNLAVLISVSKVAGNFFSGFLGPLNIFGMGWQFPFLILIIMAAMSILSLFFIDLPNRGASAIEVHDKELGDDIRNGKTVYGYTIDRKDFISLSKIKTNQNILLSGFFYVIPGGAIEGFLIYYLIDGPFSGFPPEIRTQTAQLFAMFAGMGYLFGNLFLGPRFDKIRKKSAKGRVKWITIALGLAVPFIIGGLFCMVPIEYTSLNLPDSFVGRELSVVAYLEIIFAVFSEYPSYIGYLILLTVGSLFTSPVAINRTPVVLDVNLPEHSGTSQSILNLSDQVGRGFSYLFLAFQYLILNWLFVEVQWDVLLIIGILFYIPAVYFWYRIYQNIENDVESKHGRLLECIEKMNQ